MGRSKAFMMTMGLATGALFSASAAAQLDTSAFYLGGSIGQSEARDFCDGLPDCDDTDTAWRVLAGYQFNRNFAAELGYTDLGEATAGPLSADATAWELVGVGMFPLANQFSLYGKLGFYRGEVEFLGDEESNNDVTFGAGAQYDFSRNVGVRAEWQRYADMGGNGLDESDVDVLSVGVVFRLQ